MTGEERPFLQSPNLLLAHRTHKEGRKNHQVFCTAKRGRPERFYKQRKRKTLTTTIQKLPVRQQQKVCQRHASMKRNHSSCVLLNLQYSLQVKPETPSLMTSRSERFLTRPCMSGPLLAQQAACQDQNAYAYFFEGKSASVCPFFPPCATPLVDCISISISSNSPSPPFVSFF